MRVREGASIAGHLMARGLSSAGPSSPGAAASGGQAVAISATGAGGVNGREFRAAGRSRAAPAVSCLGTAGSSCGDAASSGSERGVGCKGQRGVLCWPAVALVLLAFLPTHECASYAGAYKWIGTVASPPDDAAQKGCDNMLLSETYQTIEMGSTDLEMRAGYSAPTKYGPGLIDEEPLALAYSSFTGHMTGQNIFEGTFHGQAKCTGQFSNSQAFLHCWLHPLSPSHCLITLECYAGPCYDPSRFPQFDNDYDAHGVRRKHVNPTGAAMEAVPGAEGAASSGVGVGVRRRPPSLVAKVGRFWRYKMGGWRGTSVVAMLLVAGSLVGYSYRELQRNKMSRESSGPSPLDGYWSLPAKEVAFRPSAVDELPFDTV